MQALGDSGEQRSLPFFSPQGYRSQRVRHDLIQLNNNKTNIVMKLVSLPPILLLFIFSESHLFSCKCPFSISAFPIIYLFFNWLCCAACRILASQSGMEPEPLAVEARSTNHRTTREFPASPIKMVYKLQILTASLSHIFLCAPANICDL